MDQHLGQSPPRRAAAAGRRARRACYAAIDLGTNNCRLLIAEPRTGGGFRVMGGYSKIVRLGEGLSATGRLGEAAMARTMRALGECVARLERARPVATACVATQACRAAENGAAFLAQVQAEFGLNFHVIEPGEEARYAVLGCANLIDEAAQAALIIDIGGGSTELSFVDAPAALRAHRERRLEPAILDWASAPIGVVTLADRMPEPEKNDAWYEAMVENLVKQFSAIEVSAPVKAAFAAGKAHIVGTSGAITSLAGVHLGLSRYRRSDVDGVWMRRGDVAAAIAQVRRLTRAERDRHPCVGPDRADLVLPGCAILEAVCRLYPAERLRVADRGLREGLLMTLMQGGS